VSLQGWKGACRDHRAVTATSDQGAQCNTGAVPVGVPDDGDVPEAGVLAPAPVEGGAPVEPPVPGAPDDALGCPFELLPPPQAVSAIAAARNTPPSSTRRP
jgi:hypothetical protein